MKRLFSHVDIRVRDRERAKEFYDAIFAPLGMSADVGAHFTTYTIDPSAPEARAEWFGFTQERDMVPGSARISLFADSRQLVDRVAGAARAAGARDLDGPAVQTEYAPNYYAVFFDDPDGNKLEVCCLVD
jgi:catechol 2,3-dioxygenase-like lactoylglutathione lyase family enzyme